MNCEACRRLDAGMLHVQGIKNSMLWDGVLDCCSRLGCMVVSGDICALETKMLADWRFPVLFGCKMKLVHMHRCVLAARLTGAGAGSRLRKGHQVDRGQQE